MRQFWNFPWCHCEPRTVRQPCHCTEELHFFIVKPQVFLFLSQETMQCICYIASTCWIKVFLFSLSSKSVDNCFGSKRGLMSKALEETKVASSAGIGGPSSTTTTTTTASQHPTTPVNNTPTPSPISPTPNSPKPLSPTRELHAGDDFLPLFLLENKHKILLDVCLISVEIICHCFAHRRNLVSCVV